MKHRLLWHFFLQLQLLVRILEISNCHVQYLQTLLERKNNPAQYHGHQIAGQKLSPEQIYFQLT